MTTFSDYLKFARYVLEDTEHPMIEHNGAMVHKNNSEGKPIHGTDAGIKAFHDWAGGTELKDEHGRPQVMYHGTSHDKDFKDIKVPKNGAWFTKDRASASEYAKDNDSKGLKYNSDTRKYDEVNTASRVLPVYLKSEKTHNITADEKKTINVQNYKKAQGQLYDTMRSGGIDNVDHGNGVHSVIGGSHQIKSAIGNSGAFDKNKNGLNESDDYKGQHGAPDPESGAPLHNLKGIYPDDFHANPKHYADGLSYDHESISVMQDAKDRPNKPIKIYRAVPKILNHQEKISDLEKQKAHIQRTGKIPAGVSTQLNRSQYYDKIHDEHASLVANPPTSEPDKLKINKGDWVTASRSYAKGHGEDALRGRYRILSKTVPASELYTNGDSIHEYGYHPKSNSIKESLEILNINWQEEA